MSSETFVSVNPSRPAEVVGRYRSCDASDVDAAVAAAAAAQRDWVKLPVPARADIIADAGRILVERKTELAELLSREVGKIPSEAGGDVQEAIDMAAFIAGQGRSGWGDMVPSELNDKLCWTTRHPVGVVGLVTPWNFPIAIPGWKTLPALLAGNGVVIKPSEYAPACCEAFLSACVDAGVPAELLQLVTGFAEPAAELIRHPDVGAISFTGSVPTGRKVAASAMASGPRIVALELGGKNAMIVRPDADLDLVVDGALFGAFGTAGQRCTSTSRLIVHPDVTSELTKAIVERAEALQVGDPLAPGTDVGPVNDAPAAERIDAMVKAAVDEGATVACGGEPTTVAGCEGGAFYLPTVLTGIQPDHRVAREEVFGPVLAVLEASELDDALAVANGVEYGLSAAIYTRSLNEAMRAVEGIDTGIVYVNAPTIGAEIPLPFGGTKHTGNGFREAGTRGIEQFSQVKTVYLDYSGRLQKAQIDTKPLESS